MKVYTRKSLPWQDNVGWLYWLFVKSGSQEKRRGPLLSGSRWVSASLPPSTEPVGLTALKQLKCRTSPFLRCRPLRSRPVYLVPRGKTCRTETQGDEEVEGRPWQLESPPQGVGRVALKALTYWLGPEGFLPRNPITFATTTTVLVL